MTADTIISRLHEHGRIRPSAPAYFEKVGDTWVPTSWRDYVAQVRQAGRALIALGVEPETNVAILGFNRPEWSIMLLGAMTANAAGAGIYTTNSPAEVQYIVNHAECRVVLLENEEQWAKVNQVRDELPALKHVVMMRGTTIDDPLAITWEEFMALGEEVEETTLDERIEAIRPEKVATLIYTSGTTGPPKAVMLSHDTLAFTAREAVQMFNLGANNRELSYLPLSHIAEQMYTVYGGATAGYPVYYAESLEKLLDNLQEVRPTIFFGVPRVWERFYNGIVARMAEASGAQARIAAWAMNVGHHVTDLRNRGEEPSGMLAAQYRVADRLVFNKVKGAIGLDEAHSTMVSAAPINPDILVFFGGLDLIIHEIYGQSEGCGPTTVNRIGATKFGSGGLPFPNTEVTLGDDGEVLLKGRNVFMGYYKDPESTAATLRDGWLHSGDLGEFDEDGFLYIVGRKKEIIITSGGKNIAPKNIETALTALPLVAEAVVIGDRRKFLSALLTLNPDMAAQFAAEHGIEGQVLHEHPLVIEEIQRGIDEVVNPQFARVENVRKFQILPRNLTVEDGELTPTLKIKRRVVYEHFDEQIESMYAGLD
ncbi:MAG: AMP-dependent synthetase/ligase [Candidatus Promineifilaceae bacterium]